MNSSGNKVESAYNRLHSFRHVWIKVILALIILAAFVITLGHYYDGQRDKSISSMSRTLRAAESYMTYAQQLTKMSREYDEMDYMVYLNALCDTLNEDGFSQSWLNEMNGFGDYYRYYFIDGSGRLHSSPAEFAPEISEEQWQTIKRTKFCDGEGWIARSQAAAGGMLVQIYEDEYETLPVDGLAECGDRLIISDSETGAVLYASEPELFAGGSPALAIQPQILSRVTVPLSGEAPEGGTMYPETGSALRNFFNRSYYLSEGLSNGWNVRVYEPISILFLECVIHAAIPFIIMILFSAVAYKTAMTVRYRTKNEASAGAGLKKFTKNTFINLPSADYLLSILLISVLIIMLSTVYIQILSDYGSFCSESSDNLEIAAESIEAVNSGVETADGVFEEDLVMQAQLLADHIANNPELLDEPGLSTLREVFPNDEIDVIDGRGNITHSTGAYKGYALSSIPGDAEYRCWDLIKGDSSSVYYPLADGNYQVAVRRTDSIGIVRLTVQGVDINRLLSLMTPENSIQNTNFSGEMFYRDLNGPDTFCRISSGGVTSSVDDSFFTEAELENGCVSLKKIDGRNSCLMARAAPGFLLLNAIPVSAIAGGEAPVMLLCLLCYLLISAVLVICCSLYAGEEFREDERSVREAREALSFLPGKHKESTQQSNAYSMLFRKLIKTVLLICLAALLVFFVANHLFSWYSVISFLLSGRWGKGVNIFSISTVILMIFAAYLLCNGVNWVSGKLKRFLDSGSATAVNLAASVIRVVCVGWVFFSGLFQLGVDLTTIVAGLGIATLALSVGAKDTINDLIAGVFTVLDGHVRIGDWIDVGTFSGEVEDMNIRTTKIRNLNKVISVNNSSMVNVVNRSRGESGPFITFTVPYGTEISRLKEIVKNSAPRFAEEGAGFFIGDPLFCDIVDFTETGIKCAVYIPAEEKLSNSAGRVARRILNEVLTENGIEFAGYPFIPPAKQD